METDEPEAGASEAPAESNVVRFPRDWLGPLDELVPFGPSAGEVREPPLEPGDAAMHAEAEVVDFPAPGPVRPEDFWGEDSAAIHHALEGPQPVEERASRAGEWARSQRTRATRIRSEAFRLALMLRTWLAHVWGLCIVIPRGIAPAMATGRRILRVLRFRRIAPTPVLSLMAGAVAIASAGFAIDGLGGFSLERSAHNVRRAGSSGAALASVPAVIQLERHLVPIAPAHDHPRPPAHTPAPVASSAGGSGATYVSTSNATARSAQSQPQSQAPVPAIGTHRSTSATPTTGTAGGAATSRQVAAPDTASGGSGSGSTSPPPAGPVGPGAPFGPGHLG